MSRPTKINPGKPLHCVPTLSDVRRFLGRLNEVAPPPGVIGKCWIWQGPPDGKGYGQISVQGRAVWAHRFAKLFFHQVNGTDVEVDHKCLRPACCNPAHHETRTHGENSADANRRRKKEPAPF